MSGKREVAATTFTIGAVLHAMRNTTADHELKSSEEEERKKRLRDIEEQKKVAKEKERLRKEQNKFQKQVELIIKNLDSTFTFSSDLNSFQRKIIHDLCEKHNLFHTSDGDDENRRITIRKSAVEISEIDALTIGIARTEITKSNKVTKNQEVPFQIETRRMRRAKEIV